MLHIGDTKAIERAKYSEIWALPEYKKWSPGLSNVERFIGVIEPIVGSSLIDIGCGSGCAGLAFEKFGFDVDYLDFTDAGLDEKVDRKRFINEPIWSNWSGNWRYGFCCDVMEHIPTEYVGLALSKIIANCETSWLQISFQPDVFGMEIGETLHLTVRPYKWWLDLIASIGDVTDARDLCGHGLFVVRQ